MKKNFRFLPGAAAGLFAAIGFSSCAYDPYYGSTTVGGSYTTGPGGEYYGNDYGGASTSVFIATGNPRWGYDPSCYSYYDYTRRSYYDPYLNGYYPVGYRPPIVYGVSHPYGWSPGSSYCRPPGQVSNVTITNYRNRESIYRERGYVQPSYGRQRQQEASSGRTYDQRTSSSANGNIRYGSRPSSNDRSSTDPYSQEQPRRAPSGQPGAQRSHSDNSRGGAQPASRYPSQYHTPVAASQSQNPRENRSAQGDPRNSRMTQSTQRQIRQLAPLDQSRGNRQESQPQQSQERSRQSRSDSDREDIRNDGNDPRGRIRN